MTVQEAKDILQTEKACVIRAMNSQCNRDCYNCDLVKDGKDIVAGYETIIQALEEVEQYRALGTVEELKEAREKQPKTDWIPCEVEMPKEHDSIFEKLKGTDKWKSSMFEKVSDVVNVTIEDQNGKGVTVHACTTDGKWSCDLLRFNKSYRVTAWQPLPQPYKKEGAENECN